jgi:CBS domain-containing protein
MRVADLLETKGHDVVSIDAGATLAEAARLLADKRIGSVLVLGAGEAAEAAIAGILSERDLVCAVAKLGAAALAERVRDHMTTRVYTCAPDATIDRVMEIMTARRVRHLPVVEAGRLAGMISIGDVVKSRLRETLAEVAEMASYVRGA